MRRIRITAKITLSMALTFSILLLAIIVIVFFSFRTTINAAVTENVAQTVGLLHDDINLWLTEKSAALEGSARSMGGFGAVDPLAFSRVFSQFLAADTDLINVYFGSVRSIGEGGAWIVRPDWTPPEGWDHTGRGWFVEAMGDDNIIYTDPYIDAASGEMVLSIARRVKGYDSPVVGVMGVDFRLNRLAEITDSLKVSPNSVTYLLRGDGLFITHDDEAMRLKGNLFDQGLLDVHRQFILGQRHYSAVDPENGLFVGSQVLSDTGWVLVSYGPISDMYTRLDSILRLLILLGVIGIALTVAASVLIAHSITRPIIGLVGMTNRIAGGDLKIAIDKKTITRSDEIGILAGSLQSMQRELQRIVTSITAASGNIAEGSSELSSSSQQLSEGATEQAASAEEVSSSMEEMSANISQNADNSVQTEAIAQQAARDAEKTGVSVRESIGAMREIAEKIGVVEEIARQTNMLALNAAIEAARAGEQGKGFAVVAAEVRRLAERSQKAAAEISELSGHTVDVSEKAGEMLDSLVPDILKTAELVQEISAASGEQNTGVDQINQAIQQLDKVIQSNAAASEEIAATSEQLSSQARGLKDILAFFELEDEPSRDRKGRIGGPQRKLAGPKKSPGTPPLEIQPAKKSPAGKPQSPVPPQKPEVRSKPVTKPYSPPPEVSETGITLSLAGDELDKEFEEF